MSENPLERLAAEPLPVRKEKGTLHTPGEILQQPGVWRETASIVAGLSRQAGPILEGCPTITITGAGSSLNAARLIEHAVRPELRTAITVVSCTDLMLAPEGYLPAQGRGVLVSLSRSGESPEIVEAARLVQEGFREVAQIAVTCNRAGALGGLVGALPKGLSVFLPERSYDRGMGTTSSVTSTVVAGRYLAGLARPGDPGAYGGRVERLSQVAEAFLREQAGIAQAIADADPGRLVALGTLPMEAAAQEVAHKVLELTDGQVPTLARNFLEFRHGPIAFIDRTTTVVCLVSGDRDLLAYEMDFIRQLCESQAAREVVIVGSEHPELVAGGVNRVIPFPAGRCDPGERAILGVLFGQMLALFLSLRRGLKPDLPGSRGLVHPVVQGVRIHPRGARP